MTKYTISAQVYVHQNDTPIEVDDYKAINAWMNGHGAFVDLDGALMYIPYEAVTLMILTRDSEEVEAPEDPLCQPVSCEETASCDDTSDKDDDDEQGGGT